MEMIIGSEEDLELLAKLERERKDPDWICWQWLCRKCRRMGVVSVNKYASARRMARKIEIHHRLKSPNCQGME